MKLPTMENLITSVLKVGLDIQGALKKVEDAITTKKNPTHITIDNPEEIKDNIISSLDSVVVALREEIQKLDKEVQVNVKNDLPGLFRLLRSDKDKEDLIRAIDGLKKYIPTIPASKDYEQSIDEVVMAIKDVINAVNNITFEQPEFDLSGIEKQLKKIEKKIGFELPDKILDNNNVRVALNPSQLAQLSNNSTGASVDKAIAELKNLGTKIDTINSNIDGLEVSVGDVDLNTDQLESKVDTTNTKIDTVNSNLDSLETKIDTTNSGGNKYTTLIDEDGTSTYIGKADPGTATLSASWQILKIDESSNPTTFKYADGNGNFDNVWDNRNSLSYS